ncbi:MAG: hypothetical protein ACREQX_08680 [Candidatus Binataceae bacterium]
MTSRDVYFVGTIPLTGPFDVFTTLAELVGERAYRVPDGETGDRKLWIQAQYPILAACPALMVGDFPKDGLTRRTTYQIPVRLRPDSQERDIAFTELGYARYAIASYGLFRAMKESGRIPRQWRFQVGLPAPMEVMPMVEPESRALVEAPYERALLAELDRIQQAIPHDQLALTWDVVQGVLLWEDLANSYVTVWFDHPLEGVLERYTRLGSRVAAGVELGFHLCYGSLDHRHALEPRDLGACVNLANAIASRLTRPIDYVHMPVPNARTDEGYFAPLARLDHTRVRHVYLGLIHYTDGVHGARRRAAAAQRYPPNFGVATECGFGRRPSAQDVRRLIRLHADVVD